MTSEAPTEAPKLTGYILRRPDAAPDYKRIDLGNSAWVEVRPITSAELDETTAEVHSLTQDLRAGHDAAVLIASMLAHDVRPDMMESDVYVMAIQERLTRFRVAMKVIGKWEGIYDADGATLDPANEMHVSLFMLDSSWSQLVAEAAYRCVHKVIAEKKG
jgi:hypothetical protein